MAEFLLNVFHVYSDFEEIVSNVSAPYVDHMMNTDVENTDGAISNKSIPFSTITVPPCQWILYWDINQSRVRVWDVMILVPNALFFVFLLWRLIPNFNKLNATASPMFMTFFGLICLVSTVSVLRCIVSMTVNASVKAGDTTDRMLWLILRFFMLSTEASVIAFGFYFGALNTRVSIPCVLAGTFTIAFVYSTIQGVLELKFHPGVYDSDNSDNGTNYDLFSHGGMIFLGASSTFFCLMYVIILILPLTIVRHKIVLPTKRSFYLYAAVLALLNLVQAVGSVLLYQQVEHSLCIVDVTTYFYFAFFDPMIYSAFLCNYFKSSSRGSLLFSYEQDDDINNINPLGIPYTNTTGQRSSLGQDPTTKPAFERSPDAVASSPASRVPTPFLSINSDSRNEYE